MSLRFISNHNSTTRNTFLSHSCPSELMLLVSVAFLLVYTFLVGSIEIVSIVDSTSVVQCFIKVHSILESANQMQAISLHFLLISDPNLTLSDWDSSFSMTFPHVQFESKLWNRPPSLPMTTNQTFDKDVIFSRFYLPHIFPHLKRFLYLDNDIIVTTDLLHLYMHHMVTSDKVPGSHDEILFPHVVNPRVSGTAVAGRTSNSPLAYHKKPKVQRNPATVAFVYETHPIYRSYMSQHFNISHPWVQQAIRMRGSDDAFLNGGVFVVDAERWRQKRFTATVEEIIRRNVVDGIYDAKAVGDQGPFFVTFAHETSYLPARYNMRRLPKKTVNLLDEGITGIVHLAGTVQSDATLLCREPLKFPVFLTAVTPLYLSAVLSFHQKRPQSPYQVRPADVCEQAVNIVRKELERLQLKVTYNPGHSMFVWPPANISS